MMVEAFDVKTGRPTDDPLPVTIVVDDVNDNAPIIEGSLGYTVAEKSSVGEEHEKKKNTLKVCVFDLKQ